MSVMQRTIIVQPQAGQEPVLFDRLSDDLKQTAANWAELDLEDERFAGWPEVECEQAGRQVWARGWSSAHEVPHRLLTVSLREFRNGSEWFSLIKLGALGPDEVVLFNARHSTHAGPIARGADAKPAGLPDRLSLPGRRRPQRQSTLCALQAARTAVYEISGKRPGSTPPACRAHLNPKFQQGLCG